MPFPDYIQYKITVINVQIDIGTEIALEERQEIIISELSDMPFESFETDKEFLLAYIRADQDHLDFGDSIKTMDGVLQVEKNHIKGENWNKIWEESFEPITIEDKVIVRAPFHVVEKKYEVEIIIEPKMSFGTGHHSTTRLMMESMLNLHFENKSILDMGCGTGILAILAAKLGASKITAVDNDPQCIENTFENISLNNCQEIAVFHFDKFYLTFKAALKTKNRLQNRADETENAEFAFANEHFEVEVQRRNLKVLEVPFKADVILANIQKNVLIEQMPLYKSWLNVGGILLVSGIYEEAVKDVIESAKKNGMQYSNHKILNEWCLIRFEN